jgi:hypothetical protein
MVLGRVTFRPANILCRVPLASASTVASRVRVEL